MNITLQQNKLAKALSYVAKSVSVKPNIPVLANTLLEVDRGMLKLSATNLDMGINLWIAGQVETEGSVTVSARIFTDFVNASPAGKVKLSLEGNVIKVTTEKSHADFQTIPAKEFPILPKVSGEPILSLAAEDLERGLEKVMFACSTDSTPGKSQQTGVLFELSNEENMLKLVGLDGYRLSAKSIKVKRHNTEPFTAIVPARSLQELVKILQAEAEVENVELFINESKSQVLFKFNEVEFSIRLLEGNYPDYKKVLPQDHEYSFELEKSELDQGIKIINTFARSVLANRTDFDFDPDAGKLVMSSSVADLGKNDTEIKIINVQGDLLRTAYNLKYLADMVNSIKGGTIVYETKSPLAAAVFRDKDDPDYFHIIMPLKREN